MNKDLLLNAPIIVSGMSVIYSSSSKHVDECRRIETDDLVKYGDRLTVRDVIITDKMELTFNEIFGQYNAELFVESEYWLRHNYSIGQEVVFTGIGNQSQVDSVLVQNVARGDTLKINRVLFDQSAVGLGFVGMVDIHNGTMFVDKSLWENS